MSVVDLLLDLFRSEEQQAAFADDPTSFLNEYAPEGLTAEDVLAAMPAVCASLPPEDAAVLRTAYGLTDHAPGSSSGGGTGGGGGSETVVVDPQVGDVPPPPTPDPGDDPLQQVIEQLEHYTVVVNVNQQSFEDNDVTTIDDRDTTVDNSVNQNIEAFGDVNQNFDNDVVSGDGAVAAGDDAQVNTGAGAVQAGGDITDSTIATGDVQGSVTGDVSDSVVGDGNQVIDDSTVGAASFGEGDATNVEAENAVLGDGTIVDGGSGDIAFNQGDGDLTQIEDSTLSESVVGDGTVQSNDVAIDADNGSSVAFGEGSTATAETTDTDISGNYGTVQVAGDDSAQSVATDNSVDASVDIADSGNTTTDIDDSFNYELDTEVDASVDITDSGNTTDSSTTSDDDVVDADIDVPLA